MPYIVGEDRFIAAETPTGPGQLNFSITMLIDDYIQRHPDGLRYHVLNEVVGALECAKLELYRRVVAPYEDKAIAKNGDVFITSHS